MPHSSLMSARSDFMRLVHDSCEIIRFALIPYKVDIFLAIKFS